MLLQKINWQVQDGENWIVFGLNGSGKTTLLSIAAGYLPAQSGCVLLCNEHITSENRQRLCAQIGFVSDAFFSKYYHHETAFHVVLSGYAGKLGLENGITDAMISRAKRLLHLFDVADKSRKPFYLLSKGEQQKVLLVRSILRKPRLLFLDEPCSGLDILSRLKVLELLEQIACHEQISIVCVTHHFDEILKNYNKAMLLGKQGIIHSQGDLQEVFTIDNMSDFLGCPVKVINYGDGNLAFLTQGHQAKIKVPFEDCC